MFLFYVIIIPVFLTICQKGGNNVNKKGKILTSALLTTVLSVQLLTASAMQHIVLRGDTMWKIASGYKVGVSEVIEANPQVANPDLIYPGQVLDIPFVDSAIIEYENKVINLVNEERGKRGLPLLKSDWQLSRVARHKAQDMKKNNYFSHTSPVYGTPFQMIQNYGISYKTAGENIAKGQSSAQAVVNAWMNSSGHRANILNQSFTHIGVGYVSSGNYWSQMFIGK